MDDDLLDELMGIEPKEKKQKPITTRTISHIENDLKPGTVLCESFNYVFTTPDICCLCGLTKEEHYITRHHFFKAIPEYKCKNCDKYFYQHDHYNNPCFRPYKYIGEE
jgi:hypothetical protein